MIISETKATEDLSYLFQWDNPYNAFDLIYQKTHNERNISLKLSLETTNRDQDIKSKRSGEAFLKVNPGDLKNIDLLTDTDKDFIHQQINKVLDQAVDKNLIHFDTRKDYKRVLSRYLSSQGINDDEWFPFP